MTKDAIRLIMVCGGVLMVLDIVQSVLYFYHRRDVTMEGRGRNRYLCLVVNLIFMILSGLCFYFYYKHSEIWYFAVFLLVFAVCYFIALRWMHEELDSVKDFSMHVMESLIGMIEARDENLDGHSLYVHDLTMLIYNHLSLWRQWQVNPQSLRYASLLLDLGKFQIPDEILRKSGKLEDSEWQIMKAHPQYGIEILKDVESFGMISDWILYHHERMDGSGYLGKKGEEIPFASRIIAVADTYSALTMTRSYKASAGYEEALAELKQVSGKQLDAEVVAAFADIPKRYVVKCMEEAKSRAKVKNRSK